ncbi:MAG: hypothetical protein U5R48_13305 [Gammaproteobacteria bacterium]|nr:hypothetical protein [Gammaproteobacteria bacterium]
MLFFGTGTFFLNGDNVVPGLIPDVQSFYRRHRQAASASMIAAT